MNLHFVTDEKYTNSLVDEICKVDIDSNFFLCYKNHSINKKPTHIKHELVQFASYKSKLFYKKIGDLNQYERIFIYPLTNEIVNFLCETKELNAKVYWAPIGMDIYGAYPLNDKFLFDKKTFQTYYKTGHPLKRFLPIFLLRSLRRMKRLKSSYSRRKALERIDCILDFNEFDYDYLKCRNKQIKANLLPYIYPHMDLGLEHLIKKKALDHQFVLLGNSGDFANNHIDALIHLNMIDEWRELNIICPLAYGGEQLYINRVVEIGNTLFPSRFHALTGFVSKERYFELISKVNSVIMYHNRTQAIGNVSNLLYMGKKVFLKSQNTLFKYLVNRNFSVYDTRHICIDDILKPLTEDQYSKNKILIQKHFSNETARKYIQKTLSD